MDHKEFQKLKLEDEAELYLNYIQKWLNNNFIIN